MSQSNNPLLKSRPINDNQAQNIGDDAETILSFCPKCRLAVSHRVAVKSGNRVVRVVCPNCGLSHEHQSQKSTRSSEKTAARSVVPKRKHESLYVDPSESFRQAWIKSGKEIQPYQPSVKYHTGDRIAHPTLGEGIVAALGERKMDVLFIDGIRTLVTGR